MAWDGANLCLTYLIAFALFVLPPWRPRAAELLLGIYTVAITVVGLVVLLKAAGPGDPLRYFIGGRFAEPTGYQNANAALFAISMFPAVFLASRRETPWPARGLMLACAGILFGLALLPQSRGWLIAAPITTIVYLLLVPGLLRSLTVILPLSVVLAAIASPVLHVFNVSHQAGQIGPAVDDARTAILIGAAVLFVVRLRDRLCGPAVAVFDRNGPARKPHRARGGGVAALAGVVAAIAVVGNPASWAIDRWHDFKTGKFDDQTGGGSRLGGGLGSNRYDFWRVAANEFKDHPIAGTGSENFAEDYIQLRQSNEEPTYPHDLALRVLAGTGVIGGLLFGGFLAVALVGVGRVRVGGKDPLARAVAGLWPWSSSTGSCTRSATGSGDSRRSRRRSSPGSGWACASAPGAKPWRPRARGSPGRVRHDRLGGRRCSSRSSRWCFRGRRRSIWSARRRTGQRTRGRPSTSSTRRASSTS